LTGVRDAGRQVARAEIDPGDWFRMMYAVRSLSRGVEWCSIALDPRHRPLTAQGQTISSLAMPQPSAIASLAGG
jgi:hypothetical protein